MSIYAAICKLTVFDGPGEYDFWVSAVPGHVGHPADGYATDPYAAFLPRVANSPDLDRALVVVPDGQPKGTARSAQEYPDPVCVIGPDGIDEPVVADIREINRRCVEWLDRHRRAGTLPPPHRRAGP